MLLPVTCKRSCVTLSYVKAAIGFLQGPCRRPEARAKSLNPLILQVSLSTMRLYLSSMTNVLRETSQDREYLNRLRAFGLPDLNDAYLVSIDTSDGLHVSLSAIRSPCVQTASLGCPALSERPIPCNPQRWARTPCEVTLLRCHDSASVASQKLMPASSLVVT